MLFIPAFGFPCCLVPVGNGSRRIAGAFQAQLRLGLSSGAGGNSLASWFVFTRDRTRCLSQWLPTAHPPTAAASSGRAQAVPLLEASPGSSASPWPAADGPPQPHQHPSISGPAGERGFPAPQDDAGSIPLAGPSLRWRELRSGFGWEQPPGCSHRERGEGRCPRKDIKDLALEKHHGVGLWPTRLSRLFLSPHPSVCDVRTF